MIDREELEQISKELCKIEHNGGARNIEVLTCTALVEIAYALADITELIEQLVRK